MKLIIESEADAWAALERAVAGEGFPDDLELSFKGWPTFELDMKGRDWRSTVPTRVMPSLLDLQKDINRAYASVRYSQPNLRKLKEEDRDELEVVVEVKEGSSIFNAELWQQFSHIAEAAFGRMNGNQIVITVLGLALAIMAPVMFKAWLVARHREKKMVQQVQLSQQETERLKVFERAVAKRPDLAEARNEAQATNNRILKAAKPEDTVELKGVELKGYQAAEVVQPERAQAKDVELDGEFVVLGNRTDKSDGFRITVSRVIDQMTLNADVPLELPFEQREIIQQAEWSKSKVWLSISASMLRDSFTQAVVISARSLNDDG